MFHFSKNKVVIWPIYNLCGHMCNLISKGERHPTQISRGLIFLFYNKHCMYLLQAIEYEIQASKDSSRNVLSKTREKYRGFGGESLCMHSHVHRNPHFLTFSQGTHIVQQALNKLCTFVIISTFGVTT